MSYLHPDLHLHSTASDGTDTPLELLDKIRKSDIDIFSLTDHDTYKGCKEIWDNLKEGDPLFISGIELSCRDELGKYHILGYCFDLTKQSIIDAADYTHNARRAKAEKRFNFLEELHGFEFSQQEKDELMSNENPGKPHFVDLLLKKGYVADKTAGFTLMDGLHIKDKKLTPEEAIDIILKADGIPVLAHGILEDGSGLLTEEQMSERVKRLKDFGLMGLECYYSSYTPEQTEIMLKMANEYNMLITAGSDYHGSKKTVPLGASGNPEAENMERFYKTVKLHLKL